MDSEAGFALVGAGLVGPRHAEFINAAEGAALRVVCDLREERGRPLAEKYGATWLSDWRQALDRSDVDVVSICLPTSLHLEVARTAAGAGKHVLVEKPIELNLARAIQLVSICQQAGVKLGAILNRRFVYATRRAHDVIRDNSLGRMLIGDMRFKSWRPNEYYADSGWRGTWAHEGGAAMINQGIHGVDLMTWIMGPIRQVHAYARHLRHAIEADDTTVAICEYASGALGVIECTTSVYPRQPDLIELHGQGGSIALENYRIADWQLDGIPPGEPSAADRALPGIGVDVGHFVQIQDMARAVIDDRSPIVTGVDALHAIAVVEAIYTAERTGRSVDVAQPPYL